MGIQAKNVKNKTSSIAVLLVSIVLLFGFMFSNIAHAKSNQKIVFVSLFENLSNVKSTVSYDTGPKNDLDFRKKQFTVDRYSEIPRSLLEDELSGMGVKIVERQSLNKLLEENQFTLMSGLVDSSTALKIGKMIGANTLVCGTIMNIGKKTKHFTGYGIETQTTQTICDLRVRVIDINTGSILYSKKVKGISGSLKTNNSGESDSDEAVSSIEDAIKEIAKDENFKMVLL